MAQPSPLRVLVVDDYPDAASSACELVKLLGHQCKFAVDGEGALTLLASDYKPDIVILDIGLPDISGYDLAPRVRKLMGDQPFVLAAMTGWGQSQDLARAESAGFDRHYTKPANLSKIQEILGLAAGNRAPLTPVA